MGVTEVLSELTGGDLRRLVAITAQDPVHVPRPPEDSLIADAESAHESRFAIQATVWRVLER